MSKGTNTLSPIESLPAASRVANRTKLADEPEFTASAYESLLQLRYERKSFSP